MSPSQSEGRQVTWEEAEQHLLQQLKNPGRRKWSILRQLANMYCLAKRFDEARHHLRQLVDDSTELEDRAAAYLAWGQCYEQMDDYEAAVCCYRLAFAMEPLNDGVWYYLHNNLGFSLVALGRYAEAEPYLRSAVEIEDARHNGWKNLGLSLWGQGKFIEAADAFLRATHANAADPRACWHLEAMLSENPEITDGRPELKDHLRACRQAVRMAFKVNPGLKEYWAEARKDPRPNPNRRGES